MKRVGQVIYPPDEVPVTSSDLTGPVTWVTRLPNREIIFNCLWTNCLAGFASVDNLVHHIRSHLGVLSEQNPSVNINIGCPVRGCNTALETIRHLQRHLNMHIFHIRRLVAGLNVIFSREDVVDLPNCGFASSMELIYDGCGMSCEWRDCTAVWDDIDAYCSHVNEHVDALGEQDRNSRSQLTCHWRGCGLLFKNKASLRVHCRHHSGDKTSACPFCGIFFANNSKLIDHMIRRNQMGVADEEDESETVHSCNLCQKQFGTQRLLREHCRRHVMNHKCEYCTVTVDSPSSLQRHIAAVHAKNRHYSCGACRRSFSQRADLERHFAVHSSNFDHKCEHCGEQFRWKKQLTAHCRKHEADYKPYTHLCHLCEAKYASGFALSRHLIRKHQCTVPQGFTRFQYKKCKDGYARLQTKRCLSKNLALGLGYDV